MNQPSESSNCESDICFHCHEPIPPNETSELQLLGKPRRFCCAGCHAVAGAVVENGLEDYYRYRTEVANKVAADNALLEQLKLFDAPVLQDELVVKDKNANTSTIQLSIGGIKCAACAWLIEKQCLQISGVSRIGVDVSASRATLIWDTTLSPLSAILQRIADIGYQAKPFQADQHEQQYRTDSKRFLKKLGLAGLLTMQIMMLALGLYFGLFGAIGEKGTSIDPQTQHYFHWVSLVLCTPVVFYSGSEFLSRALGALSIRKVNMDVPISLAIVIIYGASCYATVTQSGKVYFESVSMFIFLLLISRFLEHQSRRKAATIAANNNHTLPHTARFISDTNQTVTEQQVLARSLKIGNHIRVKAGEVIPVDGIVVSGNSDVDEAMLSGEFHPVTKNQRDNVFGGTINQSSVLDIQVTQTLQTSLMQEISRLQELALSQKPRIAVLVDNIASYFVYGVLFFAACTYLAWSVMQSDDAIMYAVAVLVATCPCALGLATPTALTAAMGKLRQYRIILKAADFLENLNTIDTIVMDKTGTLTEGKFSIAAIKNVSDKSDAEIIALAASLEQFSEHPIASAFTRFSNEQAEVEQSQVDNVEVVPGAGIKGTINGTEYMIGSEQFVGLEAAQIESFHEIQANVFLSSNNHSSNNRILAAFSLEDALSEGAKQFCAATKHYQQIILSGDTGENVQQAANALHITEFYARCLPQDKLSTIQSLQQQGKRVLMIGDGINDGPVLAQADVAIAVNDATDLAKNAADVVLLNDNIAALEGLFSVAKQTQRTIKTNIIWALCYNTLALPFAMLGWLTPWMAVIGMSLSSIIVVYNSTRLLHR